ncbi:MAG: hypothetical protein ACRD5J_16820 [Nitrososphaeraceae archaeon]
MSFFTEEEREQVKLRLLDKQILERFFEHFRKKTKDHIKEVESQVRNLTGSSESELLLKLIIEGHKSTYNDWLASFDLLEIACLNIIDQRDMLSKVIEAQTMAENELIKEMTALSRKVHEQSKSIEEFKKHDKDSEWAKKYFDQNNKTE